MSGHDHHGDATANRTRLAIAFGVTVAILVVQLVGVALTGSLALLTDVGHMFTDAGGLAMALFAAHLITLPATSKRTWGFARAEILAATAQAAVLFAIGVFALVEGIRRLGAPPEIPHDGLLIFGVIGLVGNVISLAVLIGGRSANLNMRAAALEVAADALGSIGVIIAAIVIKLTGWQQADVVAGIAIGLLIIPRAVRLLYETTNVLLETVPAGLDLDEVRRHLIGVERVRDVHDLHASQIASGLPVLSAHVTVDAGCFDDGHAPQILDQLQACVAEHFEVSVSHSTFQLEPASHQEHEHIPHF